MQVSLHFIHFFDSEGLGVDDPEISLYLDSDPTIIFRVIIESDRRLEDLIAITEYANLNPWTEARLC